MELTTQQILDFLKELDPEERYEINDPETLIASQCANQLDGQKVRNYSMRSWYSFIECGDHKYKSVSKLYGDICEKAYVEYSDDRRQLIAWLGKNGFPGYDGSWFVGQDLYVQVSVKETRIDIDLGKSDLVKHFDHEQALAWLQARTRCGLSQQFPDSED